MVLFTASLTVGNLAKRPPKTHLVRDSGLQHRLPRLAALRRRRRIAHLAVAAQAIRADLVAVERRRCLLLPAPHTDLYSRTADVEGLQIVSKACKPSPHSSKQMKLRPRLLGMLHWLLPPGCRWQPARCTATHLVRDLRGQDGRAAGHAGRDHPGGAPLAAIIAAILPVAVPAACMHSQLVRCIQDAFLSCLEPAAQPACAHHSSRVWGVCGGRFRDCYQQIVNSTLHIQT